MITSPTNPRLKLVRKLASRRQREQLGLFVCEGEDLVAAALDAGIEPVDVLVDAERPPEGLALAAPVAEVVPAVLAEVSTLGHPPRILAVFRRSDLPVLAPRGASPPAPSIGLALWAVADPGNVGTLVRAADGLGPAFVALSRGCADPTSPKALRASAGAIFRVPIGPFDEAPGRRVALVAHGAPALSELELGPPVTFVLGAERDGLPEAVVAECETRATIPLARGAESLNVAVAGAIALYEASRAAGATGAAARRP